MLPTYNDYQRKKVAMQWIDHQTIETYAAKFPTSDR